jgi:hypothetical protein
LGSTRTVQLLTVFTCEVCHTEQQVPACFGGRRGRCATCGGVTRVPSGRDRVRPAPSSSGPLPASRVRSGLLVAGAVAFAALAWATCAVLLVLLLQELLRAGK